MSETTPLQNTDHRVIINAGHSDSDSGAIYDRDKGLIKEAGINRKIRDQLESILLENGIGNLIVPDELDLEESIEWVNREFPELDDGLAISIHLNSYDDPNVGGTEAFYYEGSERSEKIARELSHQVAESMKIANRGAKPDTQAAARRLAWIKDTKPWAVLVEVCFLSNAEERKKITTETGQRRAAEGIAKAIGNLFNREIDLGEEKKLEDKKPVRALITIEKYDENDNMLETETYESKL